MALGPRYGYFDTYFDSSVTNDTYAAFDAVTGYNYTRGSVGFVVRNLTGKDIKIRRGSSGDGIVVKDGFESPPIYGLPDDFEWHNETDGTSITVELIIYLG